MGLLSIVLPCYNEAANLRELYRQCVESFVPTGTLTDLEILIIDDGSKDATLAVAKSLAADPRVRVLSFSRNFGKESAMLAGLEHSDSDAVVIMDSDLQHPPSLLQELMAGYAEGYHQVIAVRDRQGDGKVRTCLSRRYYRLTSKLMNVPLEDGAGDFRLLSRAAVDAILSMPEYNRFSKGLFSWVGMRTKKVYYQNQQRFEEIPAGASGPCSIMAWTASWPLMIAHSG